MSLNVLERPDLFENEKKKKKCHSSFRLIFPYKILRIIIRVILMKRDRGGGTKGRKTFRKDSDDKFRFIIAVDYFLFNNW